jgi:N-acyl-D-amino-acid deacylase
VIEDPPTFDLLIRGGIIVDGTGDDRFVGHVAVSNGHIVAIVAAADGGIAGTGAREIEADGLLVTPGWIDIHTRYDGQLT